MHKNKLVENELTLTKADKGKKTVVIVTKKTTCKSKQLYARKPIPNN
jgi:hypothetical protein